MKLIALLLAVTVVASSPTKAAIEIAASLEAGNVATLVAGKETSRRDLSPSQLQALSKWLETRKSDWRGMITESTSEPVSLRISLKDAEGKTGRVDVVTNAKGGYYLRFVTSSEKWSYRSFGGLFKSWAATQMPKIAELDQMLNIVGTPEMLK